MRISLLLLLSCLRITAFAVNTPAASESSSRPWLGVVLVRDDAGALLVESVATKSPAERAGLRVGDRLLAVGEDEPGFLPGLLLGFSAGDELELSVERGGDRESFVVILEDWPEGRSPPPLPVHRKQLSTPEQPSALDRQEARLRPGAPALSVAAAELRC